MSVAEAFTLASKLLGTVEAYRAVAERATLLDRRREPEVGLENMAVERDENHKTLADAQVKKIREGHAHELDKQRDSFIAGGSKLLQKGKKWVVE